MQIFVSHSRYDLEITSLLLSINKSGFLPYFAEDEEPDAVSLHEKLLKAISKSEAMLVFITKNVTHRNKITRDLVVWEMGVAHALKKPVYIFVEKNADIPLPATFYSVYHTFNISNKKALIEVSDKINTLIKRLQSKK